MLGRSPRSRSFFKKLVVNGVSNSKAAIQNDCLMRLYDADAELKAISTELDSFDGKKDPIRCNLLVNQLRTAQDKVISLLFQLMDECNCERASRDYRMKFPDEILLSEGSESLNGQIWFGAECLSAGSNILNHTKESTMLRPMAKTLTTHLESLRNDLRDLVIDGGGASRINQALIKKMVAFDHIFATFEYEYVRTMLPIRTIAEIEKLQEVAVLFSETLIDSVKRGIVKQDDIEEFQPIVMIAIPRLAIVRGLLYKNENPIYTRHKSQMCSLFQPFHGPLHSIRKLLRKLSFHELFTLEKMLANDQSATEIPLTLSEGKKYSSQIKNYDNLQSNDESNGENEASTSNNFSNILKDGLQYPVGQKRIIDCEAGDESNNVQDYFQVPASSSKSLDVDTKSPVGSSSSPSSSFSLEVECKNVNAPVDDEHKGNTKNLDCDHCCVSPPESDAQLEKLISEFGPSVDFDETLQAHLNHDNPDESIKDESRCETNLSGCNSSRNNESNMNVAENSIVNIKSRDEALLEELVIKQAQQLLHRLFVAISGVADQLQSNFASDLRFILRHIFNTDSPDDENEEFEIREESSEQSDNSLPIEPGIEAQEEANLIDLESGYSVSNPYQYQNQDLLYVHSESNNFPYMNQTDNVYVGTISAHESPLFMQDSIHSRIIPNPDIVPNEHQTYDNQEIGDDGLANIANITRPSESLIYELRTNSSSPNEPSIMDDSSHRQHLVQQHMHAITNRANSRLSLRAHRYSQTNASNGSQGQGVERRSRHHGSRSRRPRGPPVWVPDQLVVACSCCNASFTLFRRRHHCRACGQIFCSECSKFTKNLNCWGYNGPVRVCESCFNQP